MTPPPPEPPANGASERPAAVHLDCLHPDRWDEVRGDIREIKDSGRESNHALREEMKAYHKEAMEEIREIKRVVIGDSTTTESLRMNVAELRRESEEHKKRMASWRQGIAAVVIAVVSPGLLWVGSEMRSHVAGHPAPATITVAASPSPSALPIVASSPGHTMASPDPGVRIVIDGQEPPPDPQPLPAPVFTPQRPGGPKPNTRPHTAACKKPAPKPPRTGKMPLPSPAPQATPHR